MAEYSWGYLLEKGVNVVEAARLMNCSVGWAEKRYEGLRKRAERQNRAPATTSRFILDNFKQSLSSIRHQNLDRAYEREQQQRREYERRLALSSTPFAFTQDEWIALCNQYDNRCLCCKASDDLTVDHVIPVSRGGRNSIDNIQPLCHSCNSSKRNKIIDYRSKQQSI